MGQSCNKFVVCPTKSTICSKIVRKQCLHACDFFHVCSDIPHIQDIEPSNARACLSHVGLCQRYSWKIPVADMEKVTSMQALLADNFWSNCWLFWTKQFYCSYDPSMPISMYYYPQLIHLCQKISDMMKNFAILGTFICLGSMWICSHFSAPIISLRSKISFFHVFERASKKLV